MLNSPGPRNVGPNSYALARQWAFLFLAVLVMGALPSCGGGGGGGSSEFTVVNTIFGFDPATGDFSSIGSGGEAPSVPKNMSIVFDFSDTIDPSSVSTESIVVQAVDPVSGAPGPLATVIFDVIGPRLVISPLITFTNSNVIFGFKGLTTYQITFISTPESSVLRSSSGKLVRSGLGPFKFVTTTEVFDRIAGPPIPTIQVVDPENGNVLAEGDEVTTDVPSSPAQGLLVEFSEGVRPDTVINGESGTSSTIRFELDIDGNPETGGALDRVTLPGLFTFEGEVDFALVRFFPILRSVPTEPNTGTLYVVTVDGTVQDLAGNFFDENTELFFRTVPGPLESPADPIIEDFDNAFNADLSVSSISWGERFPGQLSSGVGGGRGVDGEFDPDSVDFQERWDGDGFSFDDPDIDIDVAGRVVLMDAGPVDDPRVFEFTRITVPFGWTVTAKGEAPLQILATGDVTISGSLSVAGERGELIPEGQVSPGAAGTGSNGGASGGIGGSVTDGVNLSVPIFRTESDFIPPFVETMGVSGRSEDIQDFTLTDNERDFSAFVGQIASFWLQPNVACEDSRYEVFHPTFKVAQFPDATTVEVVADEGDPNYQGRFTDPSNNPWLDPNTLEPAPIAEVNDPYLIGDLAGHSGTGISFYTPGLGSLPQTVTQTWLTLGRAGGGGGGGAIGLGAGGEDDITLDENYEDPGYGGTGTRGAIGGTNRIGGVVQSHTSVRLFGPSGAFAGLDLIDHVVNAHRGQGLLFEIVDHTDDYVEIAPTTTIEGEVIDLDSIPELQNGVSEYWIAAPWAIGGAGGGGSGIHCAGSFKSPASPYQLPDWAPGVGGGAGGGSLVVETASVIQVGATGSILADGGEGGRTTGNPESNSSGGGGGGGGTIFLRAGDTIRATVGAVISARGGDGGADGLRVAGGDGGVGRIRMENFNDNLEPDAFAFVTFPTVTNEDVGRFLGGAESFGQSLFMASGVLVPLYREIEINYVYRSSNNPNDLREAVWRIEADGDVDPSSTFVDPPFTFAVSKAAANPDTGLLDNPPPDTPFFDPRRVESGDEDGVVSDLDENGFVRFQCVLPRTVEIDGQTITDVRIDNIIFRLDQTKPTNE